MQVKVTIDATIVHARLIKRASQYFIELTMSDKKIVLVTIDYKKHLLVERTNFCAHLMNNRVFANEQEMKEALENKILKCVSVPLEENVFARLTQTQVCESQKVKKASHKKK